MRPKVVKSVHYCPATRKTIERKYTDLTSLDPFPTSGVYPTKVRHGSTCFTVVTKTKLSSSFFSTTTRMKREIPWRRSLACLSTETIRPSPSRRCQRRLLLDSFLVLSRSSLTTTWWTSARCVNSDLCTPCCSAILPSHAISPPPP